MTAGIYIDWILEANSMNSQIETTLQGACERSENTPSKRKNSPPRRKGSRSLSPYERASLSLPTSRAKAARALMAEIEGLRIADEEGPVKSQTDPSRESISNLSEMFVWSTFMDATNSIKSVISDDVESPQSNDPLLEEKKTKKSSSISNDVDYQSKKPVQEERKPRKKRSKKKSRDRSFPRRSKSKSERDTKEYEDDSSIVCGHKPSNVGCDQGVANETGLDRRSQLRNFRFGGRSFPRRNKGTRNRETHDENSSKSDRHLGQGATNEAGLDMRSQQLLMYQANFQASEASIAGLLAIPDTSGDLMLDSVTSMDETRSTSNRSSY